MSSNSKSKSKSKSKPRTQSPPAPFKPGTHVEIASDDVGFRGSWYTGKIVRRASSKDPTKFLVEYAHLFADEEGTVPLREILDVCQLRPVAPKEKVREFKFGEEVDAFYNDGWWEGTITDVKDGKFAVYFRSSKEQIEFGEEDLRLHREWIGGVWKPPFEEEEDNEKVSTKTKTEETPDQGVGEKKLGKRKEPDDAIPEVKFSKGTLVEVSSDEDGFKGAWFTATIVEPAGRDKYLIEYESLRTEDDKDFLREEIDTLHIRPCPPETVMVDRFNRLDEVDALYNDGWWVGVISKVLNNSRYIVYFRETNEEMQFEQSDLRLHQDWINGKWVPASRGLKS
ncbi:hypothetical protein ACOSP7_008788 [Xanthoceras sorbifolium]|uniref:Agenet domain-containing protein n=1 Tax=Xanthoceras sorbifolium TaxID=99658 RepID=A0ABQ8GYC7_9ROSI|nr:hypothetical protein JRO89_XSUnG0123900 [Xanthoceras sorbifolium]